MVKESLAEQPGERVEVTYSLVVLLTVTVGVEEAGLLNNTAGDQEIVPFPLALTEVDTGPLEQNC